MNFDYMLQLIISANFSNIVTKRRNTNSNINMNRFLNSVYLYSLWDWSARICLYSVYSLSASPFLFLAYFVSMQVLLCLLSHWKYNYGEEEIFRMFMICHIHMKPKKTASLVECISVNYIYRGTHVWYCWLSYLVLRYATQHADVVQSRHNKESFNILNG